MTKDKMDLIWGIEQMERELSKNHSPASNIMSICTEVLKQVSTSPAVDMTKENIYVAYIMLKLSDFKYLVYSSKSLEWDIKKKAPMSIDARKIFMDVLKRNKPDLYDGTIPVNEIIKNVEKYLFTNAQENPNPV